MSAQRNGKAIVILLVEDNPADARLTIEAMKEGRLRSNICVVTDGVEALAFLRCEGRYHAAAHPDIILLDLNLPKKGGREVLAEIKADPKLKHIPVTVLSTSDAEEDILNSYDLHANCYIIKPVDLDQFMNVIKSIQDFWLNVVELPSYKRAL